MRPTILLPAALLAFSATASAQVPVQLRVVDQNGALIPRASIGVDGGAPVFNNTIVVLDEGSHDFSVNAMNSLQRDETVVVEATTTSLEFEWITSTVRLRVRDQADQNLSGSTIQFVESAPAGFGPGAAFASGTRLAMPITDSSVYPTIRGTYADGYDLVIRAASALRRDAPRQVVTANTTELAFEWLTSDVALRIADQNGLDLPGAFLRFRFGGVSGLPANASISNGSVVTLPVTDATLYPSIHEFYGNGYDFFTFGLGTGTLRRLDDDAVVLATTTEIVLEWIRVDCELSLVDATGAEVVGSTMQFPSPIGAITSGDNIVLPITDNAVYPTLFGAYADGYPTTVSPANVAPASDTYRFEVAADESFTPGSFDIAGNTYSLVCGSNAPPVADAGLNVTIPSSQQGSTVLEGTASDPDGDPLTYRWLDGADELLGSTPVSSAGEAPLDLGLVPPFLPGAYVLTLEVTDGEFTVSDTVVLTIGNAPPEVACGEGGTFNVVVDDVPLGATVSDPDGDVLVYRWTLGYDVLGTGSVQAPAGGDPIALPDLLVPTGGGPGMIPLGDSQVLLTIQDVAGATAECSISVTVVDETAPRLCPRANRRIIWPANNQLVDIVIDANASDNSGLPVTLEAAVFSPWNSRKRWGGRTEPNFTEPVIDQETGRISLQLRAARGRRGWGRFYLVRITATDQAGNRSKARVWFFAPSRRRCY